MTHTTKAAPMTHTGKTTRMTHTGKTTRMTHTAKAARMTHTAKTAPMTPGRAALPLLLLLLVAPATGCHDSPTHPPLTKLSITGSSTMAPLVAAMGKRFEAHHPGVRIDVQTGGSSRGLADTRSGLAHIGMVSRALYDDEHRDLVGIPVAHDGIGLIVHDSNPVERLSPRQVIDLYTGRLTNWRAVSAMDAPVVVVNKAEGRATLESFLHYFHLKNSEIQADVIIGDNEQGVKVVAGNPHAIGYVSIGSADYAASHGVPIKLLPLHTTPAAPDAAQMERFFTARPLTLVTTRHPPALAQAFIAFAASAHVHDLVAAHYFVPLTA